jgi:hypothetical protein
VAFAPPRASRQAEPRIEVSIGRVEVRAVLAAPPVQPTPERASPALSLDDYLRGRDSGG